MAKKIIIYLSAELLLTVLSAPSAKMVFTPDKETAIKYLLSARTITLTMDSA